MVLERSSSAYTILHTLVNKHGQGIHGKYEQVGGDGITLTNASGTSKKPHKFPNYIDGKPWGSDALPHPIYELRREPHSSKKIQHKSPANSVVGYENIDFYCASRLNILPMVVVEKFLS